MRGDSSRPEDVAGAAEAAPWADRIIRVGITPNRLTVLNLTLSVVAAGCLAVGAGHASPWEHDAPVPVSAWPMLTLAVMSLAFLIDLADGALARASGRVSAFGAVLDSTLDRYSDLLIFGGCALHFSMRGNLTLTAASLLAGMHAVVISYAKARTENFVRTGNHGFWQRGERCILFTAGMATGHAAAALAILAVLPVTTVILRLRLAREALRSPGERTGVNAPPRHGLRRGGPAYFSAMAAMITWIAAAPRIWPAWYGTPDPLRTFLVRLASDA
ncbi:MAG: hypothetical protein FLDDKLPJ_02696 [Phycisphaerae bacterium]|nr:hypothetical protein [Phycisphaerae bacterium]